MRVTSLRLYAVKSMAGVDVDHADVEPWGLAGDRRWGVVDNAGASITARKIHSLLGLRAEPAAQNAVRSAIATATRSSWRRLTGPGRSQ
ncbi:MAG TPA: MOSC N-terminal beta barrel domain-containing protein [Candidatus Dormibacteraeota bacterium]|nr:MOSC N-terminal beta barrel domain-containing protein [Candidatus Dormibacteraeota bacterium]